MVAIAKADIVMNMLFKFVKFNNKIVLAITIPKNNIISMKTLGIPSIIETFTCAFASFFAAELYFFKNEILIFKKK